MSGDDSSKEDIDPLRAAIIAQGQEHRGPPSTEPPNASMDPAAYERWLRPSAAIRMLEPLLHESEAKTEIHRRICEGEVLSVARTSNWYNQNSVEVWDYTRLGAFLWAFNARPNDWDLLWRTGTHTLSRVLNPHWSTRHNVECFGIRFDPAGIQAILADAGVDGLQPSALEEGSTSVTDARPYLAKADAERFCRALLAGWPEATQTFAHEKALLFFPDKRVSRDTFRSILGSIRGPTKPGKKPKTT